MDKIDIYVIIALTISSLLLLPSFSSALSTPNVTISASGVVQYPASGPSTPINKAAIDYGSYSYTGTQASFIASHFTLLDVDFKISQSSLQTVKTDNPNMIILGYRDLIGEQSSYDDWATVNANEAWFVHDASGNRITETGWGWYLMDVGNAGWRQHYSSYVNSHLGTIYDGVFADDVWDTIESYYPFSSAVPASVVSRWHTDTLGMIQYVKANLPSGKILILNTYGNCADYLATADGVMDEGAFHASWYSLSDHSQASAAVSEINTLSTEMATGKIIWMASGTVLPSTSSTNLAQMVTILKYCYCGSLLASNGPQAYFSFDCGNVDGANGYYSIMDTNIGQATGAYYASQNVYMRDFTSGKVLFNPSANSYTVNLGGNYKLLDGTTVSNVTLNPYSGEILLSPA